MREILFKAKRIDNDEWLEGLVTRIENTFCLIREYGGSISYECDVNTLCQYTGLTDKNGNKIWENDVVGEYSEYKEEWCFAKVTYGHFNCSCCDGVYGWTFENGDIRCHKIYEVKGNIFDNPELIGV